MHMTNPLEELDEVLRWWTDENHTGKELSRLRQEIAKASLNPRQRAAVEESALNLLSSPEEQYSDRPTGGRTARLAGFTRIYSTLEAPLRNLIWNFAIADAIAIRYQRPQASAAGRIATFVALASAGIWSFNNGDALMPELPPVVAGLNALKLTGIAFIVLFTILSFHYRIQFRQLRHRYLMARSLAEALRIDFFQRLAGTGFHTLDVFAAHHETTKEHSITFKALETAMASAGGLGRRAPAENPTPDPVRIEWAEYYWVEAQHRYFGKPKVDGSISGAAGREAESARSTEAQLRLCFALTSFAVVASLSMILAPAVVEFPSIRAVVPFRGDAVGEWIRIPKLFGDLLTPVLGIAAALLHQRSAAHAVTAQKYRRAALVISEARHHLSSADLTPAFRLASLRYVAYQSVAETADWGVYQREQSNHIAFR